MHLDICPSALFQFVVETTEKARFPFYRCQRWPVGQLAVEESCAVCGGGGSYKIYIKYSAKQDVRGLLHRFMVRN